ncbi:MAG: HPr family phosphocarrier protein [Eubacteriales bacterium]
MDKALETKLVYNYKIELTTLKDVKEFVKIATKLEGKLSLKSGAKLTVNAKSLLGVLLAQHLNWNDLTLTSDRDRYFDFKKFIVDGTN